MDTNTLVAIGRQHLEKGALAEAKKQAKAIAKLWESQNGSPTEEEWRVASQFLGEILAMQAIWSSFKLKPAQTKKFLEEAKSQTDALAAQAYDNLDSLFG